MHEHVPYVLYKVTGRYWENCAPNTGTRCYDAHGDTPPLFEPMRDDSHERTKDCATRDLQVV